MAEGGGEQNPGGVLGEVAAFHPRLEILEHKVEGERAEDGGIDRV